MTLRVIVSSQRPPRRRRPTGDPRRLIDDLAHRIACGVRRERAWVDLDPAEQHEAIAAAIEIVRRAS